MVKNKRDLVTPRRRASFSKKQRVLDRSIAKVLSRPATSTNATQTTPSANIKVVVRVRPPNIKEDAENNRIVVKIINDELLIFDPEEEVQGFFFHGVQQKGRDLLKKVKKNMRFIFDKIFPIEASNTDVFKDSTYSLIKSVMEGYNCSVFAYGATGAGKTFTMTGTSENPGITFLTMTELFKQQEDLSAERDFELGITYLEVYNELVKDLLNPGPPLNLREDSNYGVIVAGIKVFKINNADELFKLLEQGNQNRTQHPTDANAESSRSHAVFQVYIKMTTKTTKQVRTAKLSMIDLAGSERGSATGYGGARFTEGANINKSLLALGNCINSLADGQRHIPYRDSKLTRLLKDSLGGNCQTVMIANVSPSSLSYEDTYNTLKYATRAKKIKSIVQKNIAKVDLNVVHYVKVVEDLTKENQTIKKQHELVKQELEEEKEKTDKLEKECQRLRLEIDMAGHFIDYKDSIINRIKVLIENKRELMERQFELEKSQNITSVRRLFKEEIENRLSDLYPISTEKDEIREKINSTISRFKKQEYALQDDIEKAEDSTDEIDRQIDELLREHPTYRQYVIMEKLKLSIIKAKHRILLERKNHEALLDDQEGKSELIEKMAHTLSSFYRILKGHNIISSNITKQYQEITQCLIGRKNIKWGETPDSGMSSASSLSALDENRDLEVKRKVEEADQTFSVPSKQTKSSSEPYLIKGTKTLSRSQEIRKMAAKSPRNNENIYRKPFDSTKSTLTTKSVVNSGLKVLDDKYRILKNRPKPLSERPRFRR